LFVLSLRSVENPPFLVASKTIQPTVAKNTMDTNRIPMSGMHASMLLNMDMKQALRCLLLDAKNAGRRKRVSGYLKYEPGCPKKCEHQTSRIMTVARAKIQTWGHKYGVNKGRGEERGGEGGTNMA